MGYLLLLTIIIILIVVLCSYKNKLDVKVNADLKTQYYNDCLQKQKIDLQKDVEVLYELISDKENQVKSLSEMIENNEEVSNQAFNNYQQLLENKYEEVEQEFDNNIEKLREALSEVTRELDKMKQTRAAAHEALLREQEVKDNKDNYRLKPSDSDLADARRLEVVKRELNKPRILAMLIWQTYYQPLAKQQFPLIIQSKTKCGIYKITNLITDECYIGQSVDIYKRWCDHCKCGLGIDTPAGNKLYKSMQEYGLENFTFEVVEECNSADLDEKEKYFISLYQADTFGYNSTIGNKGVKK